MTMDKRLLQPDLMTVALILINMAYLLTRIPELDLA